MLKNRPFTFCIRKWGQIPEYMQEFLVDIKAEFDNYRSFWGQSEENGPKLPWIVERMVDCLKHHMYLCEYMIEKHSSRITKLHKVFSAILPMSVQVDNSDKAC